MKVPYWFRYVCHSIVLSGLVIACLKDGPPATTVVSDTIKVNQALCAALENELQSEPRWLLLECTVVDNLGRTTTVQARMPKTVP